MLVKLTSSTSGEIIFLSDVARQLFDILDKTTEARGVFTYEQLPEACEKLRLAIALEKEALRQEKLGKLPAEEEPADANSNADKILETRVNLAQRASPLLRLMERTQKEEGFILWEAPRAF